MLVLSRRPEQRIYIGEAIVLAVISVDGQQVTLGFEAPIDVVIRREEIYQGKKIVMKYAEYRTDY